MDGLLEASTDQEVCLLLPMAIAGLRAPESAEFSLAVIRGLLRLEREGKSEMYLVNARCA